MDKGASLRDRATRALPRAAARLGHAASIASAFNWKALAWDCLRWFLQGVLFAFGIGFVLLIAETLT